MEKLSLERPKGVAEARGRLRISLRSRRLEVVGTRKNARERSPSRASVLSFAHYFQAPATQATSEDRGG